MIENKYAKYTNVSTEVVLKNGQSGERYVTQKWDFDKKREYWKEEWGER